MISTNRRMKNRFFATALIILGSLSLQSLHSQDLLAHVEGRNYSSLNGKWEIIVDPFNRGELNWGNPFWKEKPPTGKTGFYEYGFEASNTLNVPGDWNSQRPELNFYEGTVWYRKQFIYAKKPGKKSFLYFGGVNYRSHVYLNDHEIGQHEGGFTPFQFDITDQLKEGWNSLYVSVNNRRSEENIPAMNFDWWNYGGIMRDVYLVETPAEYILDYFIQLAKGNDGRIQGWVQLSDKKRGQAVKLQIPEMKLNVNLVTDDSGRAILDIPASPVLWSPEKPKLYAVKFSTTEDNIDENIGFRTIAVSGTEIILNGKPVFLRGINFHEENPQRGGRAYSEADAMVLLNWAKELGCNFVRLTHYPQNEHMVRMAEKMGILLWEEIPLWQGIQFTNPLVLEKAKDMLRTMITRDKNRCGIILWSMSNETAHGKYRDSVITSLASLARQMDPTRLITSALMYVDYADNTITISDPICKVLDVIGVNEYLGWYKPWPAKPEEMKWESAFNKPLIMSEFGAEALFGQHGSADTAGLWNEEFQEQVYKDQITMLKKIPFLRGICPWILTDFRSPNRLHPVYQQGWNRKGLISEKGDRKKAWYVVKDYYGN